MKFLKFFLSAIALLVLVACGGGGGSAGKIGGSAGATATVATISLSIVDASGAAVASNAITNGAVFYVQAVVRNASQNPVNSKRVTFTTDAAVATLAQSSALTNTDGVAKVQISALGVTSANAGNVVAAATIDSKAISADLDYQTVAPNVTLTNMQVSPNPISALQSSAVQIEGRVNGALAGSSVVTVNFSAGCGSFVPPSASTDSSGVVRTTYQSAVTCSGPITLTAQTAGASSVTSVVTVTAAQPSNVIFKSATVPLMVTSVASGGLKQSTLTYQVLNNSGTGMSGVSVDFSLDSATISGGVQFSVGGTATTAKQVVSTDGNGNASVTVTAGSLPTPVVVTGALSANTAIQAKSTGIAVTSGRATQNAASLSATKLSIEGWNVDGAQTTVTMRVADRQGNPVPVGTIVNFVASHGLVQGTCTLDAASQCSATYTSQGLRPSNGRAAILAYLDGEESFTDMNGDNIWQSGEPFSDIGMLYRDDNESGVYDAASEQTYPGGATGSTACASADASAPWVANTCDGTWSSSVRVRRQIIVALATSEASVASTSARTASGFTVRVTDLNGNAMPTGTTVAAAVKTNGATCTVSSVSPNIVRNSPNGGSHRIGLDAAADCGTVRVEVTVTSPGGVSTVVGF